MQSQEDRKSPGESKKLKALTFKKRRSVVTQEVWGSSRRKRGEEQGEDGHEAQELGDQDTGGCKG